MSGQSKGDHMETGKAAKLWIVNVISFVVFVLLAITGLVNWLLLPRGFETARGGFLFSLRHVMRESHEWLALMFIVIVAAHLYLHWGYLRANLKRYKMMK